MTKYDYLGLRGKLYDAVGALGTHAELTGDGYLEVAYQAASEMLDAIDEMGIQKGYLDPFTLELLNDCTKRKE